MGLNNDWQNEVQSSIKALGIKVNVVDHQGCYLLNCEDKLWINLISLQNTYQPENLLALQNTYNEQGKNLIHLWQDVWLAKKKQVLSRFSSFLGFNVKVHARATKIIAVEQEQTIDFLNTNHLQGYVKAKFSFGLTLNDELIALASFSLPRLMKSKGINYQSAELVRFASKNGITIVGGLSKLIKYYVQQVEINDLMTYADRDWSLGKGYDKLGFKFSQSTEPAYLYVNTQNLKRYFSHRLPKTILQAFTTQNILNLDDFLLENHYVKVFNTGNLKYHLHLK